MIKVMEVKKVNILKKTSGITVSFLVGIMCAIGFLEVLQKDEETIYNNNINFSLKVIAKNNVYKKETFKIPKIN